MTGRWVWLQRGLRVGVATVAPLAAGVLLIWLVPTLLFGYPLVLLPLLLAGPLAVVGLSVRRALGSAVVAGVVSAVLGTAMLVFGSQTLGAWMWGLVIQASLSPMPAWTPHITVLPTSLLTWAQQDILFLQPLVALAFACASLSV